MKRLATIGALVIGLVLSSCGGDEKDSTTKPSPAPPAEAPSGDAAPSDPSALPPEFVKCMADQGFEIKSSADIHSAPQQVLQACFGSLHQAGAAP